MLPGNFKRHAGHIFAKDSDVPLLKAAAIYGANGAGKSNLVKSISLLKDVVEEGSIEIIDLDIAFKNKSRLQPTHLEIEFFFKNHILLYGLEFGNGLIYEEWLYSRDGDKDIRIFERKTSPEGLHITIADKYYHSEKDKVRIKLYEEELLREDVPFLSLLSKSKESVIQEAELALEFMSDVLTVLYPESRPMDIVHKIYRSSKFFNFSNDWLAAFDTGISRLGVESIPLEKFFGSNEIDTIDDIKRRLDKSENTVVVLRATTTDIIAIKEDGNYLIKKLVTYHKTEEAEIKYEISDESDGTRRLLEFIPAFYGVINHEKVYIIDEIDRSIHPYLLKQLLSQILNSSSGFKGQLIFTTHESNLLSFDMFRQDEIWFVEKDKVGATHLYSLSDFDVRADLDWRKGYLTGRFGAIPFLGNLRDLKWENHGQVAE